MTTPPLTKYQVGVAAEAFAACLLSQSGCDVSIQYGANQPGYDLTASKCGRVLHVSVKGSQDGGWGLSQRFKNSGTSYLDAAELWCAAQAAHLTFCFVQFQRVAVGGLPRAYLATPREVAEQLKCSRGGSGNTILYEDHRGVRGAGKDFQNKIPTHWLATMERVDELLRGG